MRRLRDGAVCTVRAIVRNAERGVYGDADTYVRQLREGWE
jgi:hypothetical protein